MWARRDEFGSTIVLGSHRDVLGSHRDVLGSTCSAPIATCWAPIATYHALIRVDHAPIRPDSSREGVSEVVKQADRPAERVTAPRDRLDPGAKATRGAEIGTSEGPNGIADALMTLDREAKKLDPVDR
jgi:hypothetical protein